MSDKLNLTTILVAFLSFILGLVSNLLIGWINDKRRFRGIEGGIKSHLQDVIGEDLTQLKEDYEMIIVSIEKQQMGSIKFKAFESFNSEIYKANNPSDYYKIYYSSKRNRFKTLIAIYSIIDFLKENFPFEMHANYVTEINSHLDKFLKEDEKRLDHFRTCKSCNNIRNNYIASCRLRVSEVTELKKLIDEFLKG